MTSGVKAYGGGPTAAVKQSDYFTNGFPSGQQDVPDTVMHATRSMETAIDKVIHKSKGQQKVDKMTVEMVEFIKQAVQTISELNNLLNAYANGWQGVGDQLRRLQSTVDSKDTLVAVEAIKKQSGETMQNSIAKFKESLNKIQKFVPTDLSSRQGMLYTNLEKLQREAGKKEE